MLVDHNECFPYIESCLFFLFKGKNSYVSYAEIFLWSPEAKKDGKTKNSPEMAQRDTWSKERAEPAFLSIKTSKIPPVCMQAFFSVKQTNNHAPVANNIATNQS